MPDHLHAALRGSIAQSPQEIALCFQNNLAYILGQTPHWQEGYYVGTFSDYDMGAIRVTANHHESPRPHPARPDGEKE